MVVVFSDDANQVDMEVYRLRGSSEEVKGAYDVRSLRNALQSSKGQAVTLRLLPPRYDLDGREIVLHQLPAQVVDEYFARFGS